MCSGVGLLVVSGVTFYCLPPDDRDLYPIHSSLCCDVDRKSARDAVFTLADWSEWIWLWRFDCDCLDKYALGKASRSRIGALTAFAWDVTAAAPQRSSALKFKWWRLRRNRPSYFIVMEFLKLHEKKVDLIKFKCVIKLNKEKKRKSQNCPHPHCPKWPTIPLNKTAPSPNIKTFSLLNSFLYVTFLCVCVSPCHESWFFQLFGLFLLLQLSIVVMGFQVNRDIF